MDLNELFRSKKLKLTKPRKEIIEVLMELQQPVCLDELHHRCKSADFSSVFRNVKLFESLGLVEEISFGDKKPRYEFMPEGHHHHHIRCEVCGRIDRIDDICLVDRIKNETGYSVTHHVIEFTGVCPRCQKK